MKFNITIISIVLFASTIALGQTNEEYSTREVNLDHKDSTISARILNQKINSKLNNNLEYHWYMSDHINTNMGGYSGYLLHGECLVFTPEKKLLQKREYYEGLKHGVWKKWNSNGKILSSESWNKGIKEGSTIIYHTKGGIIKKLNYRNGQLHGKCTFVQDTVLITKTFKNGKEVLPKIKDKGKQTDEIYETKEKKLKKKKEKVIPQKEKKPAAIKKKTPKPKKDKSIEENKLDKSTKKSIEESEKQ